MTLPLLFAADESSGLFSNKFWEGYVHSILWGLLGIALMLLAMKVFDWISPRIDIQTELAEKKNMAVAVVVAAIIIGVSYIVGVVIS